MSAVTLPVMRYCQLGNYENALDHQKRPAVRVSGVLGIHFNSFRKGQLHVLTVRLSVHNKTTPHDLKLE